MSKKKPTLLMILDGWGHRQDIDHNAIAQAVTPNWDAWMAQKPYTLLACSGEAVGLPEGQMGNSEVGHMTIGSGQVVDQELTKISKSIRNGEFFQNQLLNQAFIDAQRASRPIHVMGLLSDGGVHSDISHWLALIDLAKKYPDVRLVLHVFLDGRDTSPKSAKSYLDILINHIKDRPNIQIGSMAGRFFGMDRDNRWERIEASFLAIMGKKPQFSSAMDALNHAYDLGETDEFVAPCVIEGATPLVSGDTVLFMNFRADRARQMAQVLTDPAFSLFDRLGLTDIRLLTLTHYGDAFNNRVSVVFPAQSITQTLGAYLADSGLTQWRIAETEKYAHVTFFFNGGRELPYANEDRLLIPSPPVKTYDLQPEMSLETLCQALEADILACNHDVIICNVANGDMVGHTGVFAAALQAAAKIDEVLGRLASVLAQVDGQMLVTADHGNIEDMFDAQSNQPNTAHTCNPVPLMYVGQKNVQFVSHGGLSDIAPTLIALLGLSIPVEMTGRNLIKSSAG
jgi:2,3-bisphosphoglycerate-independent phosphoglycerate mutase